MIDLQQGVSGTTFKPLTWRRVTAADHPNKQAVERADVLVSCSDGHIARLGDHKIDKDGVVTPSLECPTGLCGWHEHARLVDWRPR